MKKLFNKGKSTISGMDVDDNSVKRPYKFHPQTPAAFSDAEAAKLKRLYPNQLISLEDIQRQFEDNPAQAVEVMPPAPAPAAQTESTEAPAEGVDHNTDQAEGAASDAEAAPTEEKKSFLSKFTGA